MKYLFVKWPYNYFALEIYNKNKNEKVASINFWPVNSRMLYGG